MYIIHSKAKFIVIDIINPISKTCIIFDIFFNISLKRYKNIVAIILIIISTINILVNSYIKENIAIMDANIFESACINQLGKIDPLAFFSFI